MQCFSDNIFVRIFVFTRSGMYIFYTLNMQSFILAEIFLTTQIDKHLSKLNIILQPYLKLGTTNKSTLRFLL